MTTWKWLDGGNSVEVSTDSKEILSFKLSEIKEREWLAYYDRMADIGEVFSMLRKAKLAFLGGLASYEDAFENATALVRECNIAASKVYMVALDVDVFFAVPGLSKAFGTDRKGLIDFAMEFVAMQYTRSINGG